MGRCGFKGQQNAGLLNLEIVRAKGCKENRDEKLENTGGTQHNVAM